MYTPARNFRKFCTPVPQYPEVLEVRLSYPYPELFEVFCKTFIPEPGTSVSSVRPMPQYPWYGYSMFCARQKLLRVVYACATIPGTSGSSGTLPYPYAKLLEVL